MMEKMEHWLSVWVEDQNQRCVPLSLQVIQAKARSRYNNVKSEEVEGLQTDTYEVSRGWFDQYKKCYNFHSLKVTG